MSISDKTNFYLNFQQFGDLKLQARTGTDEAARAVAQQFEGLFVQQMLSAMRAAAKVPGGEDSSYLDFYQEMYDKQLAQSVAGRDRLGLARMIMRQLPAGDPAAESRTDPVLSAPAVAARAVAATIGAATPVAPVESPPARAIETPGGVVLHRVQDNDFAEVSLNQQANPRWQQTEQFVADILPGARIAARKLGVSAELLVAQSALETGWGRHAMQHPDGRNGFSLFGIKAGADWPGEAIRKDSLEYRDGALVSEVSQFRAYASPAQSLADYVDFIQSSPRYAPVAAAAADDQAYIRGIHAAGYATDPDYADKVLDIMHGGLLQETLARLDPGVTDHA